MYVCIAMHDIMLAFIILLKFLLTCWTNIFELLTRSRNMDKGVTSELLVRSWHTSLDSGLQCRDISNIINVLAKYFYNDT